MEFTYGAYQNLLEKLKNNGYTIADYHDYNDILHPCILRHDIDYSLEKAVKFAEIEKNLGIKSTYFILLTSDFYNVFSEWSRDMLCRIIDCGHKIGLHFDETAYGQNLSQGGDISEYILYEKELLESVCQQKVSVVSMHRPSKGLLEADLKIPGMINSYSQKFFKEFKYVSDSRMRWREDVMKYVNEKTYEKLHILTHAFWYEEENHDMKGSLVKFLDLARKDRYEILNQNFTNLSEAFDSEGKSIGTIKKSDSYETL